MTTLWPRGRGACSQPGDVVFPKVSVFPGEASHLAPNGSANGQLSPSPPRALCREQGGRLLLESLRPSIQGPTFLEEHLGSCWVLSVPECPRNRKATWAQGLGPGPLDSCSHQRQFGLTTGLCLRLFPWPQETARTRCRSTPCSAWGAAQRNTLGIF